MAKEKKSKQPEVAKEEAKQAAPKEMSLEESRAYRAGLHKPSPKVLNESQKREEFRIFWTSQKAAYGKAKSLEKALWLHLKAIKMDSPEQFAEGLDHFGLKKVK
jgi:hypothetical protein